MKAVVIHATGGPEQLALAELPDPLPGPGEVLLDVAYAGCNWADTQVRHGHLPACHDLSAWCWASRSRAPSRPSGRGVSGVKVGDRVAAFPDKGGAYAEKCVAPAAGLIKLPDGVGLDVGAAFPIQALTAYHMLYTIYGLEPGDTVLVDAVGGGIGLACAQLAVRAGARVIGGRRARRGEARWCTAPAKVVVCVTARCSKAVLDFTNGEGVPISPSGPTAPRSSIRTFDVVSKRRCGRHRQDQKAALF